MSKMTVKTTSTSSHASRYSGLTKGFNGGIDGISDDTLYRIINLAQMDAAMRFYNALLGSNHTTPTILSLRADFAFCPMSLGTAVPCSNLPPKFVIHYASSVYANTTVRLFDNGYPIDPIQNSYPLDADIEQPAYNILQTLYAAVRVDLGNPSLNNFILNPLALNATIVEKFPATPYNQDQNSTTSWLYYYLHNPNSDPQKYFPLNVSGPAHVQVVYPCRFRQRKPLGSLIASVLVATLSMFSGAWAIFIFAATAVAKRADPAANRCDGHCSRHRMAFEPSWFDSYSPYGLQSTGDLGHPQSTTDDAYTPLDTYHSNAV